MNCHPCVRNGPRRLLIALSPTQFSSFGSSVEFSSSGGWQSYQSAADQWRPCAGWRRLWIHDLAGRPPLPLFQERANDFPVWSPDGKRVAFQSGDAGVLPVFWLPDDGLLLTSFVGGAEFDIRITSVADGPSAGRARDERSARGPTHRGGPAQNPRRRQKLTGKVHARQQILEPRIRSQAVPVPEHSQARQR